MANGVTTEWEDIHVKLGNFAPRPTEKPQAEFTKEAIEKIENYNELEKKDLDELDDLEDELDEEILNKYKKERMKEIEEYSKKQKYGEVREISREDYIAEVTNANPDSFVVLHLYITASEKCLLINQILVSLAAKYPLVKFLNIMSTRCIENFPDDKCPCFIIYKAGKLVRNIPSADKEIGKEKNEDIEDLKGFTKGKLEKYGKNNNEKDLSSDEDDREYMYKKNYD